MPFLTVYMLWGALAAVIPVAIHLFFRSRYRTVPWAAMKFLMTSVEQTSRRLKFQEYVLMLTRIAVLVFLALALARPVNLSWFGCLYIVGGALLLIVTATWALAPFWRLTGSKVVNLLCYAASQAVLVGLCIVIALLFNVMGVANSVAKARGEGDAVDAVLVFDTSFSLGANDGAKSRIDRAKAEALKIIDELPPHSTVQIITCAGNTRALVGPHSPANLDQAKHLVENLELTHLGTDLAVGVAEAKAVLAAGNASNKELYLFSDMQQSGFEQQSGKLRSILQEIKEKATIHFVRCGTRTIKNVAIVGITPQTGIPRPGERVGFAVLVRNTSSQSIDNLKVTLSVDGDEKNLEPQAIPELKAKATYAVTLNGKLDKPGLRILTAKVSHDELEGDNRFDQVILVRDQVNILVVDGKPNDKEPSQASSYLLMHALVPVKDSDRAKYHYNPRVVPARLASPQLLKNQDICILVNCPLQTKVGVEGLPADFVEALDPFVRKEGHGLVIFSGDNVKPEIYNKVLGKKLGLLPMPLKASLKADKKPFKVDRQSFRFGPPAFWIFKDDEKYYKEFDEVEVWQHLQLDEHAARDQRDKEKKEAAEKKEDAVPDPERKQDGEAQRDKEDNPLNVILRINNNQPIIVSQKIDAGEVIFVATAAHDEGLDAKTANPNWTDFGTAPEFIPFMHVTLNHLMHGQTQTYNLVAGQALNWFPKDKQDNAYYLMHPDGKRVDRLGIPEKHDKRLVVIANDLPRAGIYRVAALARNSEANDTTDPAEALKKGTPIAVIPDLNESEDLTTLTDAQINTQIGFEPIHIIAGETSSVSIGADRINREWTVYALLAVMALVMFEVVLAWWCGRAW